MAKIYFRYGTMDSSKTARLCMDAYEYQQRGEFVLPMKPVIDTRSATGYIESRAGLKVKCLDVEKGYNVFAHVSMLVNNGINLACVFVDEAQFLTYSQVLQLRMIATELDIPVMCYGLRTDFTGQMFEGSKTLFELAEVFEEVKTICREEGCRHKAMFNVRYENGKPTFKGDSVKIGDTKEEESKDYYVVKCATHFLHDFQQFTKDNMQSVDN
ncbi:TPA: thymidine kinase [Bacillus cereus]|nr:thymidine kinase [Bacillus cereus]